MRYLLVGNAPHGADAVAAAAARADIIVQVNSCAYGEVLPRCRANYVFLTNTGDDAHNLTGIMDRLLFLQLHPAFTATRLVLARNPALYFVKKCLLEAKNRPSAAFYRQYRHWELLSRIWPIQTVSLLSAVRLEHKLLKLGMLRSFMPSTGMVAYDWLRRRLQPWDYLFVEGFTSEGLGQHPWTIEKQLIKPVVEQRARPLGQWTHAW